MKIAEEISILTVPLFKIKFPVPGALHFSFSFPSSSLLGRSSLVNSQDRLLHTYLTSCNTYLIIQHLSIKHSSVCIFMGFVLSWLFLILRGFWLVGWFGSVFVLHCKLCVGDLITIVCFLFLIILF